MPQVSLKDTGRHHLPRNVGAISIVNTDLHLVCKDGVVNTHQAVLSWASGFLRRIFMSQLILEDGGKRKEDITLHFPDFGMKIVTAVTNFLVTGELNLRAGRAFREDFEEAWEAFRIDRISFKEVFEAGRSNKRPPTTTTLVQNSVGLPNRRPTRSSQPIFASPSPAPQTPPSHPSKMKMKSKLKNPFKTGQNKPMPPGPPGPPGLATSSPIVLNPSKKLPLSFLRKNQSLLFKSPRFSSTPIRPFTKPNMSTIPEKLFKNTEVSITLSSEHGKSGDPKVATLDEDMPVIVDEVKGNISANEVDIKDELPKGISITKQIVTVATNKAKETEKAKAPVKSVKNSQVKLPAYVKKMTGKGHKKIIGGKLKKKDLKRKAFPVVNNSKVIPKKSSKAATNVENDMSGRRTSSRLSTATFMTYNEDVIESSVFDKKQDAKTNKVEKNVVTKDVAKPQNTVETEQHRKLLNSTKKLMIPLKKVQGDKIATESKPMQVISKEPAKPVKAISQSAGSAVKVTKKVINLKPQESTPSKAQDPQKTLAEKLQIPGSNKEITVSITRSPAVSLSSTVDPDQELLTCYICKQTKDKEQRSLNLKNVFYVRSHISKCLYNVGKLFKAIPPGKENSDKNGIPVDEFGLKNGVWYNCEVEGCWLAQKKGVSGQVCYKVYAIHMASQHGALEMVMMEDGDKARELVEKLMDFEEKKKKGGSSSTKVISALSIVKMEKFVDVTVEENSVVDVKKSELVKPYNPPKQPIATSSRKIAARKSLPPSKHASPSLGKDGLHNCFLCSGVGVSNKKDAQGLSFKDLPRLKDHYSKCLYNESKYVKFVPPGEHNSDDVGNPIDELGVGYRCEIKGCWLQKKTGDQGKVCYKVLAHHMASQHGVLEKILEADSRPFMKELLKGMREVSQLKSALVGCRFEQCSKLQFKADNKREIKLHYAGTHFSDWFRVNPETGVPENFSKSGNRAVCETCTGSSDKPVYIQGEKEAIRGHLVVKHDKLADILIQAGETVKEAREVISDLYPDRLTDVYMDTLDKHTLPLNEDFMSKISL